MFCKGQIALPQPTERRQVKGLAVLLCLEKIRASADSKHAVSNLTGKRAQACVSPIRTELGT